ncbi:MAG: dienelactone hydrolase family protein [Thermoplasmata archaeon]|jgi:carboxymethylenebutenolidase
MRDDDRLLNLTDAEFGTGVVGVCDICGTRQAVIVLKKERFKLCVLDFLNKTWLKTDKKPGVPALIYRSERVTFDTGAVTSGKALAIVLSPTKVVKHPVVLLTPDVYGITTTLLDAAIRFAHEGFEVMIPDIVKTEGLGSGHHFALRSGAQFRGGVAVGNRKVAMLLQLYGDALDYVRGREMVDPAKAAVFGTSYGGSLALALAAQDTRLAAVALAYPMPVRPPDLAKLVTVPLLYVRGSADRRSARAGTQLVAAQSATKGSFVFIEIPGARHDFLARDLSGYEVGPAEAAWTQILAFLKRTLMPPPPKPPAMPPKPAPPAAAPAPKPLVTPPTTPSLAAPAAPAATPTA